MDHNPHANVFELFDELKLVDEAGYNQQWRTLGTILFQSACRKFWFHLIAEMQ
jgi:hypothetical protein